MKIRIHKILKNTKVEGPKTRYCIWFQGCSRHCNGCWAKATWDFNAGIEYDVNEILTDILNTKNIDGVTYKAIKVANKIYIQDISKII